MFLLFSNITKMVITFYFAKKEKNKEGDEWKMATIDTRTEEEIKQELEQCVEVKEEE
jgi:formiminotetrahydrofolate cyclodeaminase